MNKLKGALSEATGGANIAKLLTASGDMQKAKSTEFLLPGDGTPFFILQSKQDEHCFTGKLLLHYDGDSATSTKRRVVRYPYFQNRITNVQYETAGSVDRDVELKFTIGNHEWSIDVAKAEHGALVTCYKTLVALSEEQYQNSIVWSFASSAMDNSGKVLKLDAECADPAVLTSVADAGFNWLAGRHSQLQPRDYSPLFERCMANEG